VVDAAAVAAEAQPEGVVSGVSASSEATRLEGWWFFLGGLLGFAFAGMVTFALACGFLCSWRNLTCKRTLVHRRSPSAGCRRYLSTSEGKALADAGERRNLATRHWRYLSAYKRRA
jgi:hypothetical protein